MEFMKSFQGELFAPDHGYLPVLAGKTSYAHTAALVDVLRTGRHPVSEKLQEEIATILSQKKFAAIVIRAPILTDSWFMREIEKHYYAQGMILKEDLRFGAIDDIIQTPLHLYLPRP